MNSERNEDLNKSQENNKVEKKEKKNGPIFTKVDMVIDENPFGVEINKGII